MFPWRPAVCAAALAWLVSGCGPGTTRTSDPTVSPAFIGIQMPDDAAAPTSAIDASMAAAARAGAGLVRQPAYWSLIEPQPGQFDPSYLDTVVAAAARRHIDVLPMLLGTPAWAGPVIVDAGPYGTQGPPADPRNLAHFAVELIQRYGPGGSFWREHPGLPARPIRVWQVWNEPNLPQYWGGRPDARAYVRLLRVVGAAIHGADSGAEVVSAGIPNSRLGIPFSRWVDEFFRAGGRGTFDAFGLHGYAATPDGVLASVTRARALLRAHGAGKAPIRLTEFGWADRGPLSPFTVSSRTQAFDVSSALTQLAARHRQLGLQGIVYFALRDGASRNEANHGWGFFTGLLDRTSRPKPAFGAFARTARRIRR
jgi:hypothetical protein